MALTSFEAQLPVAAGICLNAYSLWTRVWHGGMICLAVGISLDILTFASSFGDEGRRRVRCQQDARRPVRRPAWQRVGLGRDVRARQESADELRRPSAICQSLCPTILPLPVDML